MTYDLYVIKPEHDEKYGSNILDYPHLFEDEWYKNTKHTYSCTIWKCWRNNYFDEPYTIKNCIPKDLQSFYSEIFDKKSAQNILNKLKNYEQYIDIRLFNEWLSYWIEKDAKFYLSR